MDLDLHSVLVKLLSNEVDSAIHYQGQFHRTRKGLLVYLLCHLKQEDFRTAKVIPIILALLQWLSPVSCVGLGQSFLEWKVRPYATVAFLTFSLIPCVLTATFFFLL